MIPITAVIATKNEESRISRCLKALEPFDEVIVVDSGSEDGTREIALRLGATLVDFSWNGRYPKKRQWCLNKLSTRHDWIFFVDADEIVTEDLIKELKTLRFDKAGYFVQGRYIWKRRKLLHGQMNNKLCLLNCHKFMFPEINDLDIEGMGEMEGHYQPVLHPEFKGESIGQIRAPLDHYAENSDTSWMARHDRYALWEAGMNARNAWPADPMPLRQALKKIFRGTRFLRPLMIFLWTYAFKAGFLDGRAGLDFALSRAAYYRRINAYGRAYGHVRRSIRPPLFSRQKSS